MQGLSSKLVLVVWAAFLIFAVRAHRQTGLEASISRSHRSGRRWSRNCERSKPTASALNCFITWAFPIFSSPLDLTSHNEGCLESFDSNLQGVRATRCIVSTVAGTIVNAPFGEWPSRFTADPVQDGSEVVTTVPGRILAEFVCRLGFADLLDPAELA